MNTEAQKKLKDICLDYIRAWKESNHGKPLPISYGNFIEECRVYGSDDIQRIYEKVWGDNEDESSPELNKALWDIERVLLIENVGLQQAERIYIGRRIAELRKEQNLTQAQLGDLCGIKQAHIARIETGRYSVGLDTLALIAEALGMRVDFIKNND